MSRTWRVFAEDEQLLSFLGQTGTAAQRPFVPTLFRCCGLAIVCFLFSLLLSVSFIPLLFLSPCRNICCLTYWPSAGMLSAVSLSQTLAVSFISKNRKNPSIFMLFCAIYPFLLLVLNIATVALLKLYQWVFVCAGLRITQASCWWLTLLFLFPFYSLFHFFLVLSVFVSLRLLGNIKNTEPLDSKRQRVHTFWVTAFDCGKNRAQADAQVVVTVKPSCKPGWIGKQPALVITRGFRDVF